MEKFQDVVKQCNFQYKMQRTNQLFELVPLELNLLGAVVSNQILYRYPSLMTSILQ